ncbi:MAG: DNA repair protein RecN [Prevotellaceae bacterium]|jgi:DNA repair protein RecN (Recombination protein N)|nr:DNA repair protein RecN [Prevotellaceae bacterium]
MLQSLTIENYALISKLHIDFDGGFSVITGETGAGKSIILGALGLVLGQRADGKSLKDEQKKCVIEAVFNVANYDLSAFFTENELDYDAQCIIRREVLPNGKSRSFINDTPINVNILKDLSDKLIDIHSQHENLLIANKSFQFDVVDTVAKTLPLLADYRQDLQKYKALQSEIEQITQLAEKEKADEDYFRFQFDQLNAANLQADEQAELEAELEVLNHTEEIKTALTRAEELFDNEEKGILISLKNAEKSIRQILPIYNKVKETAERLTSSLIELKDVAGEVSTLQENLEFNQERLTEATERLNLIYDLQQKHRVKSIAELLEIQKNLEEKLQNINSFDEKIESLKKQEKETFDLLTAKAREISEKRKSVTAQIETTIYAQLSQLGMPSVQFIVSVSDNEAFNAHGSNEIDFLFSANKNMPPRPMGKIASGGEISRVMLCIKSLLSENADVPTLILDEIDTGVSGDIADRMGNIMRKMAEKIQVLSITHLPQIAAKGAVQYKVFKTEQNDVAETQIKRLAPEERVREIAQMLSGAAVTEAAIKNAEALLNA